MKHFDLIVIGGGSGGLAAAQQAATLGAKVALIEMDKLGGTCINTGCIPKKVTWYAAQLAETFRYSSDYGFKGIHPKFDFATLAKHRAEYLKTLNKSYEKRLQKNNIAFIHGIGEFSDQHTIKVNGDFYTATHIIIATGCTPNQLDVKGAELGINSDIFFSLKKQPKRMVIVGGGYIGVELASLLQQLGTEVILLIRYDKPLRKLDSLLGDTLSEIMLAQGIQILQYHTVNELTRDEFGKINVHVNNQPSISNLDAVLFAIGRHARTEKLNLNAAQVNMDQHGFIPTNKWEATNVEHIYAIGDITGKKLLTPVAISAGRRLATRLFGGNKNAYLDYENIPTVIFTHPPIGSVGLSEKAAIEKYGSSHITIYHTQFKPLFFALSEEKITSRMKLITLNDTGKIIGCHMIGLGSDEILQGFAVAIKMGATKRDLDDTVAIHPTNAEELVTMPQ